MISLFSGKRGDNAQTAFSLFKSHGSLEIVFDIPDSNRISFQAIADTLDIGTMSNILITSHDWGGKLNFHLSLKGNASNPYANLFFKSVFKDDID